MSDNVFIRMPGYSIPKDEPMPTNQDEEKDVSPYAVPPVVWMFLFLLAGYFGIRWIMED